MSHDRRPPRAAALGGPVPGARWALEDCRHLSRRLERDLLVAGRAGRAGPTEADGRCPTLGREPGKSDPIDALAVARAALREPGPAGRPLDGPEREVRLLVDHREDLVAERTRAQNRLRWHLHELDPGRRSPAREPRPHGRPRRARATGWPTSPGTVARIARELVGRIRELTRIIDDLEREISRLVAELAPTLLALPGCGPLTAAKLVGEAAGIDRFRSTAAFARHNGSAPVPVWSGNNERHRLSRTGNRQLNVALHRIAITQIRLDGRGQGLRREAPRRRRHQDRGDPRPQRRISDEVYRRMRDDEHLRATRRAALATAA